MPRLHSLFVHLTKAFGEVDDIKLAQVVALVREVKANKGCLFFAGNGGSAAVCDHMAADYQKNGGVRTMAMNSPAMLTCLSNDRGYGGVYSEQILVHGSDNDVLFAISSSGRSVNILNAVHAARARNMTIVTLSGMAPDAPLREMGDINFHVRSNRYGVIEITHEAILHAILDTVMEE